MKMLSECRRWSITEIHQKPANKTGIQRCPRLIDGKYPAPESTNDYRSEGMASRQEGGLPSHRVTRNFFLKCRSLREGVEGNPGHAMIWLG